MPLPLLNYQLLHQASQGVPWLQQDAFHFAGADWRGVQASSWESSEQSWDNGDPSWVNAQGGLPLRADGGRGEGRWHGPGALHVRPSSLWIAGATEERLGHDALAHVAASTPLRATWEESNPGFIKAEGGHWHLVLQDATSGTLLDFDVPRATLSRDLPALTGHAILWARIEGATRSWALPPDYLAVRGLSEVPLRFKYLENGVPFIWDYEADVGRRPADQAQKSLIGIVLWDEYTKLVQSGGLHHRGEWSQYISDGGTDGLTGIGSGPWSALRLRVGNAPFEVADGLLPAPGAVLHHLHDGTFDATPLDPLACSVSAFEVMRQGVNAGEARLGGTIATRNGPATAYWHFHPVLAGEGNSSSTGSASPTGNAVNATLLGVSRNNYQPMCEASLYPTVADLLELPDGTELVLTYSTLFRYDPQAPALLDALPGLPASTQGHPGGRCLRTTEGNIKFFTEYFGDVGAPLGSDGFAQFYNTLRTLDPRAGATTGRGTVFHGHNAAESCWGQFYGWVQNASYAGVGAQQFLAYLQGGSWVASGLAGFPANVYHWQRLRRLYTKSGARLVLSGKAAQGEGALWGIADGQSMREASLPFRPRRLTRVTLENGQEKLYAVGRFVSKSADGDECNLQQSAIVLDGAFKTVTLVGSDDRYCTLLSEALAAGLDPTQMVPFLWWVQDETQPAHGYWLPKKVAPLNGRPYLQLDVDAAHDTLCYILHNGPFPYPACLFPTLELTVYDDGGIGTDAVPPVKGPQNAGEALLQMPPGSKFVIVQRQVPADLSWDAVQISDVSDHETADLDAAARLPQCATMPASGSSTGSNQFSPSNSVSGSPSGSAHGLRKLAAVMRYYPNLWLRCDSDASPDDLTTYDNFALWNTWQALPRETLRRVEVCALVPLASFDSEGRVFAPVVEPRSVNQLPVGAAHAATFALLTQDANLLVTEDGARLLP